jgi:hypothetical protein
MYSYNMDYWNQNKMYGFKGNIVASNVSDE